MFLINQDLTNKDFSHADLRNSVIENCNCTGANFTGALLTNCNFKGTTLTGATFDYATYAEFLAVVGTKNVDHHTIWTDGVRYESDEPFDTYTAMITQSSTDAPEAVEKGTNEVGEIVYTRDSAGVYTGTLEGAFPEGKTVITPLVPNLNVTLSLGTVDTFKIYTFADGIAADGVLDNFPIEIRVYP